MVNHDAKVAPLRPAALQSKPARMSRAFEDPDKIMQLIHERAPYQSLTAYHGGPNGTTASPWFRTIFTDDLFLQNPAFISAARDAFSSEIVRPLRCTLNLNGPMGPGAAHLDLPTYRGFVAQKPPMWLLMVMSTSGLFAPWMVPLASGLAWFYRGVGGGFEYWPDGPEAPPVREEPPLWNVAVMSDNEYLWHRVCAVGTASLQARLDKQLRTSDRLHSVDGSAWEIRDDDRPVARLEPSELRVSLLWKAYVLRDEDHVASFENRAYDLTMDQVIEVFLSDLHDKGVRAERPADVADPRWRSVLSDVYRSPFDTASNS